MSLSELHEEIDRSFGDGPNHRPVEARISAGHRALRRRRTVAGIASLAVLAVLGGGAYALAPGGGPATRGANVATDPTAPARTEPTPAPSTPSWMKGETVRYVDGELQIRPGVVVHEHLRNPYGHTAPDTSAALDLTFRGQRSWVIVQHESSGDSSSSATPSNGWADFDAYVADQVAAGAPGPDGWPTTLRLAEDGAVVASEGSEILQRTDDPRLGDSFAQPGTPTGAALVRPADNEQAYFVVWRVIDGALDVITTPPDDVVGATFEELLSYARSQYASGEGLR